MVLTFERAVGVFEHAIRRPLDSAISPRQVVNECGAFLFGIRPWKFLERGNAFLSLRANVTGTLATISGTTLTLVGAFADYDFLTGDRLEITDGGAGAVARNYTVASRTSDDAIELASAPGDSTSDVGFTLHADACALPDDFGELLSYEAQNSLINSLSLVNFQRLLDMRTNQFSVTSYNFFGAILHAAPATGGEPVPRLEVYPASQTNLLDELRIHYRSAWVDVDAGSGFIGIPDWFHSLFFHSLREFAQGYEGKGDDQGGIWDRTDRITQSTIFLSTARRDARIQPDFGMQGGGNAQRQFMHLPSTLPSRFTVNAPS